MKVAFFSGCLEYSLCLANALSNQVEVDYFYSQSYVSSRDESILDILDSKVRKFTINNYRTRDIRNLYDFIEIARKMKEYDIVHVQSGAIWLHILRWYFKTPIVCTVHDPVQHQGLPVFTAFYQHLMQQLMIMQSCKVIVHGDKLKDDLIRNSGVKATEAHVIPHGEFSFYKKFASSETKKSKQSKVKKILFFGAIRKNKGLEYLIEAEKILSLTSTNFKIVIAGKFENELDNNYAYYKQMIIDNDKYEIIDDYIPNSLVADLFYESDIVVLPYVSGSQSGVLSLALGYGKPVVVTDVGSIGELLEEGKAGMIVPPRDAEKLAKALRHLLENEEVCREFGVNAMKIAAEKLSWDKIAEMTVAVYNAALKAGRSCH